MKKIINHLRDIIFITIISTAISLFFIDLKNLQWNWFWLDVLYSFMIGSTLWKGNELTGYIIDRMIKPGKSPGFNLRVQISGMILFSVFDIFLINYLWFAIIQGADFQHFILSQKAWVILLIQFVVTMIIGLSFYVNGYFKAWKLSLKNEEALKREKLALQYESLKNQVNPHFLFNSLNTLSSLVYTNPNKADAFIRKLSEIYRYIIEQKDIELIDLREEMEFIEKFVELLKIRFGDNLIISFSTVNISQYKVIPISVQMLIENAIKHNKISEENPLRIEITIQKEYLLIKNNFQPKKKFSEKEDNRRTKIGLQNLKDRYEYLTGKEFLINDPHQKSAKDKKEFIVEIPLITSEIKGS